MDEKQNLTENYELELDKLYKITGCVGSGGSSKVYRAINQDRQPCLIKELFPSDTGNLGLGITRQTDGTLAISEKSQNIMEQYRQRAFREYEIIRDIRVINDGQDNDSWFNQYHKPVQKNNTVYTVIESSWGDMLDDMMSADKKSGYFKDFTDICGCILRILEALEPIHKKGYFHLDISPDNIHVLKQEVAGQRIFNLIDFNSAYNPDIKEEFNSVFSKKEGYSANELKNAVGTTDPTAKDLSFATDLYSVAVIFFELLTGRLPGFGDTMRFSGTDNVVTGGYLADMSGLAVTKTNYILKKGLKKAAEDRYQTIEELRRDITGLIKLSLKRELATIQQFNPAYGNFVGRETELKNIDDILSQNNHVFLYGVGGIGKSELAKKYAMEYRDKYDIIQLVNYADNLKHTVAANMQFRNLDENQYNIYPAAEIENYLFRDKLTALRECDKKVLIIIDNYNVVNDVSFQDFIKGKYKIIFTTKCRHRQNEFEVSNVGEKLFELFEKYYESEIQENDKPYINDLMDLVGGNTLVVGLIAQTMFWSTISAKEMYEKMKESIDPDLPDFIEITKDDYTPEDWVMYKYISKVIDISEINKNHDFINIMVNMCIIPYTGTERKIFIERLNLENSNSIKQLINQGWINHIMPDDIISLHPLISEVMAQELKPDSVNCGKLLDAYIKLADDCDDKTYVERTDCIKVLNLVCKRIKDATQETWLLYTLMAKLHSESSKYRLSLEYYIKALAICEKLCGTEHQYTAINYYNISSSYSSLGNYETALEYCIKALAINEKIYDAEHSHTKSYNQIGVIYDNLNEYDRALEYHTKALEIREKLYGAEHSETANSYNNIGVVYNNLNEYDRALEYHTKALAINKKVHGKKNANTAASYDNIGTTYLHLGEYKKALEYYFKSLKIYEKVYGTEHAKTAEIYGSIGMTNIRLGEYETALKYNSKALNIQEAIYGASHPETAENYGGIGMAYNGLGKYETALEYFSKTSEICEKVNNAAYANTMASSYNNIGIIHNRLGRYKKALEYYFKASAIYEKIYSENHPYTAINYNNIGAVYDELKEYNKALKYRTKALEIYIKIYGENHSETALSYDIISAVYYGLGKYSKALEYCNRALEIYKKIYGENHPNTIGVLKNIQYLTDNNYIITESSDKLKKIGRNEPCPCNSGKKYKKCCGENK